MHERPGWTRDLLWFMEIESQQGQSLIKKYGLNVTHAGHCDKWAINHLFFAAK